MPRKKVVDVISRLEALSKDESMPLAVREDAGRELVRLTLKDQPAAPTPIVKEIPKVSVAMTEDMLAAFRKIGETPAPVAKPEPEPEKPVSETPPRPVEPEPGPRQQGSQWTVAGRRMIYLGWDAKDQMHLLSDERPTGVGTPEVIRVSEDRLVGKKYARPPRGRGNFESFEECRERLARERVDAQSRWNIAMGVGQFSNDPQGC